MMNIPGQFLFLTVPIGGCLMLLRSSRNARCFLREVEPFEAPKKRLFLGTRSPWTKAGRC